MTTPAVPVTAYADGLLSSVVGVLLDVLPYAAAVTVFAIGVGMLVRWLGHVRATDIDSLWTNDDEYRATGGVRGRRGDKSRYFD